MADKITFAELKDRIAEETGFSRRRIHGLLKETIEVIREGLLRDGYVSIAGIGRFTLKERPARSSRHPRTGEPIEIPSKQTVLFKPDAGVRRFIDRASPGRATAPAECPAVAAAPVMTAAAAPPPAPEPPIPAEPDVAKRSGIPGMLIAALAILLLVFGTISVLLIRSTERESPIASVARELIARTAPLPGAVSLTLQPSEAETPDPPPTADPAKSSHLVLNYVADPPPPPAVLPEDVRPEPQKPLRYAIITGDSLWTLADRYYSAPYLWPNIYRVNRETVVNPDILEVGQAIAVPPLEGTVRDLAPTDIHNTASGYYFVYEAYRKAQNPRAPFYLWVAYRLDGERLREETRAGVDPGDLQFIDSIRGHDLIRQAVAVGFRRLLSGLDVTRN